MHSFMVMNYLYFSCYCISIIIIIVEVTKTASNSLLNYFAIKHCGIQFSVNVHVYIVESHRDMDNTDSTRPSDSSEDDKQSTSNTIEVEVGSREDSDVDSASGGGPSALEATEQRQGVSQRWRIKVK